MLEEKGTGQLTEFRGATGTVVCLTDAAGDGRGDGCVTVEFDQPVMPFEDGDPWPGLNHAMGSFERIDEAPKRRRWLAPSIETVKALVGEPDSARWP